mgnify:CR=1 FL=1
MAFYTQGAQGDYCHGGPKRRDREHPLYLGPGLDEWYQIQRRGLRL